MGIKEIKLDLGMGNVIKSENIAKLKNKDQKRVMLL